MAAASGSRVQRHRKRGRLDCRKGLDAPSTAGRLTRYRWASSVSPRGFPEDLLGQRQLGQPPLQLGVLLLQLLQPLRLIEPEAAVLLAPSIVRHLGETNLTARLCRRPTLVDQKLSLPQLADDLLVRVPHPLHGTSSYQGLSMPEKVALRPDQDSGSAPDPQGEAASKRRVLHRLNEPTRQCQGVTPRSCLRR